MGLTKSKLAEFTNKVPQKLVSFSDMSDNDVTAYAKAVTNSTQQNKLISNLTTYETVLGTAIRQLNDYVWTPNLAKDSNKEWYQLAIPKQVTANGGKLSDPSAISKATQNVKTRIEVEKRNVGEVIQLLKANFPTTVAPIMLFGRKNQRSRKRSKKKKRRSKRRSKKKSRRRSKRRSKRKSKCPLCNKN